MVKTTKGNTYKLSFSFQEFLVDISEGFLTEAQFDKIFSQFETNAKKYFFDNSAESNLFRILSAILDKKSFLTESLKYDHHIEIICAISSLSNYLTDIVVRNPEYLYLLFDQHALASVLNENNLYFEVNQSVSKFKTLQSKTRMLRNIKRKYLLRIGTADILGFYELEQTTENLSILARAISSALFTECYNEIEQKYDINLPANYTLCSLGKLGGNELNYSSDIDLILFYKENFEISSIKKDYHEIISEALQLFIKEATSVTAESYLYRVDFRLRPDGRNSLLCRSLPEYLRYYETRGEDWERQMMIKLSFVTGDVELFNQFKEYIDALVYPKTLRNSVGETIRRMKRSIEQNMADELNIKLLPGGIRDIEFSVQALQLMNGGKNPKLKTGNTLTALKELNNFSFLTESEFSDMKEAYIFYRKIEHFVQLMNDKQTHSLPSSPEASEKLSRFLNYNSSEELMKKMEGFRNNVRQIYESILGAEDEENSDPYEKVIFADIKKSISNRKFLSNGISLLGEKQFDEATVTQFRKIEPYLMKYLEISNEPDLVLDNFVKVIRNANFPSVWYNSFEDELFFNSFLHICEYSQRAIDLITTSKKHADLFLSKSVFQQIDTKNNSQSLESVLLSLSIQHATKQTLFPKFSQILTSKIKNLIENYLEDAKPNYTFFLAGLGSLGNEELSFGSDIDLIVVVDDLNKHPNAQAEFQEILINLQSLLKPFEVDFRLRPEGKSSPLVWDLPGYQKYINTRMRIWEFQALSKLKHLYGSKQLFNDLSDSLEIKLKTFTPILIDEEVVKMYRSKMSKSISNQQKIDIKNSAGAIIAVDSIMSLLLLKNARLYRHFIDTGSINKFEAIESDTPRNRIEKLRQNFINLKNFQIGLQNIFNQTKSVLPNNKNKLERFAKYFGYGTTNELLAKVTAILKDNSAMLNTLRDEK